MDIKPNCTSEYGVLEKVVLCKPVFMSIVEPINEVQTHYLEDNIDTTIALKQHDELCQRLEENGVEVLLLPHVRYYPEQVFTRDIGFTIGDTLFKGNLESTIRTGEEEVFKQWLKDNSTPFTTLSSGVIEGGDVILDRDQVYIGDSSRTDLKTIQEIRELLPSYEVHIIPFDDKYLHLDCVFQVISETEALIFSPAIDEDSVKKLKERYDCIEVSEEEQFTLGTNVLSIGNKKIISMPQNHEVNKALTERGYKIIEVNIDEIIKSGGAFRCITLPLVRK
ncbi:dimethylarginine dimethylaminohydrolase family protein [Bacillus sp. FJAT-45350]|uniref:dimethylarginine dimethylaminohydrolase family protein n=1 Tax=Bacillus sp. FJAT-45350 TaxID=2011014 RepID=UPI000BB71CBB|nr:arginine deiminase family protein [Bacillus sp. FJAT-45350]